MSDIVERLIDWDDPCWGHLPKGFLVDMRDARLEIIKLRAAINATAEVAVAKDAECTRLRAEIARLRAALDAIREATDMGLATSMQGAPHLITNVHTLARAALGEQP